MLAFVKTVSMVQRVLEPEGGRVRNVEEENRVRQVFQKFGGEEKVGVLSIKNLLPYMYTACTSKPDDWPFLKYTLFPACCSYFPLYLKHLSSPNSTSHNVPCPSRTLFKNPMTPESTL